MIRQVLTHNPSLPPDFLAMVPIVVYAQVLHEGIPMIAQPASNKKKLHKLFGGALCFACTCNILTRGEVTLLGRVRYFENFCNTLSPSIERDTET